MSEIKEVEVVASYSGKIATGRFENEAPFFSIKKVVSGPVTDEEIKEIQQNLSQLCYEKFSECEQRSLIDRIQAQRKDIRFYDIDGQKYPSITSIIGWDKDFFIKEEELLQYAARGTIVHKQIELFLQRGEWLEAKDIPEIHKELVVVRKGSLNLSLEGYHFDGVMKAFKFGPFETETRSVNNEFRYAGRKDFKGVVDNIVTLADWKTSTTLDKNYVLKQLAAHIKCPGNEDVMQVMAVPINNTTAQGFSKPLIVKRGELEPYWEAFKKDRENFKYRFNC